MFPLDCVTVFDFENHDLSQWHLSGTAFNNQPTYGDNPTARRRGQPANQQGDYWIGTVENRPSPSDQPGLIQGDGPQGSMTSSEFPIIRKNLVFLIGSGCDSNNFDRKVHAQLLIDGNVVLEATPTACTETMSEMSWNVTDYAMQNVQTAQLRLVDNSSIGWGHINFDYLRQCDTVWIKQLSSFCIAFWVKSTVRH